LKRRDRLADKERFRQVRQDGVSHAHRLLILCLLPNDQAFSRCGFTVSRRLGKAVQRNRVRRRIHEAVRLLWEFVAPGWDMVWIARPAIQAVPFADIQEACCRLLRRARIMKTAEPVTERQPAAQNTEKNLTQTTSAAPAESSLPDRSDEAQ
jgi:ribonuclease P protein component